MDPEISDAIKEQEFREAAAAIIKSRHRHGDGSEASITLEEADGIERRIIEEENSWKLKSQAANSSPDAFVESTRPKKIRTEEAQDFQAPERKPKTIVAGCNCGQLFNATFSDSGNPAQGGIKIKTYDAGGSVTDTYSTGSTPETYSAGGAPPESYSASGSRNRSYGTQ